MNLPLKNRLQKRSHRDVALLEDVIVRVIYELDNTVEIHGGTCIWRCYGGRRFSKDVDVYVSSKARWADIKEDIKDVAGRYNAKVLKVKDTENLIFIELLLDDIYSEIDINYKKYYRDPEIRPYETLDGSYIDVLALPPEALILEKMDAYKDRQYLTDLYDIRVLVDRVGTVPKELREFIMKIRIPADVVKEEERLRGLVYEGAAPSFKSLVGYIKSKT